MKPIQFLNLSIFTLIRLHTELEHVGNQLAQIAFSFEDGQLDFEALDDAVRQVDMCRGRLEKAFTTKRSNLQ